MNTHVQKAMQRLAAVTCLLIGASAAACSSSEAPMSPPPATGGTPPAGTGGSGGGVLPSGGSGGAAASACSPACPMGQVCSMGTCMCPAYAPNYCEASSQCANFTKDPAHCGSCTTACTATQACSASTCMPELMPLGEELVGCGSLALIANAGKLYVLSTMTGQLSSIELPAGGAATPIGTVAGGSAFAIDASSAYIAAGMGISKLTLEGGAAVPLVTETAKIADVAVVGSKIYYAVGKDVKEASTTAAGAGTSVAVGVDEGTPEGVAVSGTSILYASNGAMNVEVQPIGGAHIKLGASQGSLVFGHRSVQTDGTNVYWANQTLQGAAFAAADHTQYLVANAIGNITAYAIDTTSTTAYFASDKGDLEKAMFKAEKSTWLARGLMNVTSIATDDANVYVAAGCKILKTTL